MTDKATQVEANYRRGDPITHCGMCQFYQGGGVQRCSKVMGTISPFGISDVYKAMHNPFGPTLAPNEVKAIKLMAADAQDRSGAAAAPGIAAPAPAPVPPAPRPPIQPMPRAAPPMMRPPLNG